METHSKSPTDSLKHLFVYVLEYIIYTFDDPLGSARKSNYIAMPQ